MKELQQFPALLTAAKSTLKQHDHLLDLAIQIQQIPSPTDNEEACAAWVATYFRNLGIKEVTIDKHHNVYARIPGKAPKPALMVSAHIDTVFPADTNLNHRVNRAEKLVYGPSIGDNSAGVAALLGLSEALMGLEPPPVDIWLVANTGEEGLGDLRGMKAAVDQLEACIGACIVIEGMGLGRVVHQGLGSKRFSVLVEAPGGHSWSDFGTPSAIHVLVQIATEIAQWQLPKNPRSTFNIGRIMGGRSVNTIAQNASFELDLRSEDGDALSTLVAKVDALIARYQTESFKRANVSVKHEVIGDRPSGQIDPEHPLVRAAVRALKASGLKSASLRTSSTDANVPLSRNIPAVCVGVTEGGSAHRMEEWINSSLMRYGVQHIILLTWWSALWLGGKLAE